MSDDIQLPNRSAGLLFIMAKHAARRAHATHGTLGEQLEVMTAVVLCAVVAEAAINEIAGWFEFHRQRPPFSIEHSLPYGFERFELRAKWSVLPLVIRQKTFEVGSEPWQSFDALVELRNTIVHLQQQRLPKKVQGMLKAKKLAGQSLEFGTARWACDTMASMFKELTRLVKPPAKWIDQLWLWTPRYFPPGLSTPGSPWKDSE